MSEKIKINPEDFRRLTPADRSELLRLKRALRPLFNQFLKMPDIESSVSVMGSMHLDALQKRTVAAVANTAAYIDLACRQKKISDEAGNLLVTVVAQWGRDYARPFLAWRAQKPKSFPK